MVTARRWTVARVESMPEDGNRYEIIDGALHVTAQPSWGHQLAATWIAGLLNA
jgi:hypothetical protein